MDVSCILESCCCFYSSLFIFSFFFLSNFQALKNVLSHFSQELWGLEYWNLVHTWTVDVSCILESCCCSYSSLYVFIFLSLQFSSIKKYFVTLFSGTVRPRSLKLGTHMDSGQMYRVYRNQAAALIHPFISSFFFLSSFQALKFFVTLFSGTVRPRKLKLGTHVHSGQMYRVYWLLLIHPFIFHFSFSPVFNR